MEDHSQRWQLLSREDFDSMLIGGEESCEANSFTPVKAKKQDLLATP